MPEDETRPPTGPTRDAIVERVMGPCPFPPSDPRVETWFLIGRTLAEVDLRNQSQLLARVNEAPTEELPDLLIEACIQRFDLLGQAGVAAVMDSAGVQLLADALSTASTSLLEHFSTFMRNKAHLNRSGLYVRLRLLLAQRSTHWAATALQTVRERTTSTAAPSTDPLSVPSITAAQNEPTSLGRNINRLRKECGWSFDRLAEATGLDKKLILGHVNAGRGTHPRTLKTYAEAFTKELKRPIKPDDLST
jgi:hypothetical protein